MVYSSIALWGGVALLFLASMIPTTTSAPTGAPPGRRTHYICGPMDPFCQFFEVCDVATRPNCPCIDSEGHGEPIFTHACPPFYSCEPFSPETRWLYHVCKPFEGSPGGGSPHPVDAIDNPEPIEDSQPVEDGQPIEEPTPTEGTTPIQAPTEVPTLAEDFIDSSPTGGNAPPKSSSPS